jgi:4-hydroxybenzoate polyprenyltransferase
MKHVIKLIRPHHWVKNLLIFAPLVLSFGFYESDKVVAAFLGFIAMSLIASAGYIFNDLQDLENDKSHPDKQHRPLASGNVSSSSAWLLLAVLLIGGLGISLFLELKGQLVLLGYVVLNGLYSLWLKQVRWLDIVILSSFYLLRIFLGGYITDTVLTNWFIVTCSFAFLAISANKRMLTCKLSEPGALSGRDYESSDRQQLFFLAIAFAFAAIVFLNLHTIQLIGSAQRPFGLVVVNLLSTLLLLAFFDDRKTSHDDPVKKFLSKKNIIFPLVLLVLFYLYLLGSS